MTDTNKLYKYFIEGYVECGRYHVLILNAPENGHYLISIVKDIFLNTYDFNLHTKYRIYFTTSYEMNYFSYDICQDHVFNITHLAEIL